MKSSCELNTRAGASTVRCSGLTAETFITARPRLPATRTMPPSGANGFEAGRSTFSSALVAGASFQKTLPSSPRNGSMQCARKPWPRMVLTSSCSKPASSNSRIR
ncbi:hypothetical protein D3C72_1909700 [compost metagenome]